MKIIGITEFKRGLVTKIEAGSIPRGAVSNALNWLTNGDRITLRRGMKLIGTDAGTGKVTGLHTFRKVNGTEVTLRTRGKKVEYYDIVTEDWIEIGTDKLGTSADGETVAMVQYNSNAGNQGWLCSPNSSLYKFMVANITDFVDQYDSTKNFKGLITAYLSRLFLWKRVKDKTGVYGSHIDTATYTTVTSEAIGGSGATRSGTLAFKAGGAKRTCFAIVITDTVETFTDDYSGNLVGSLGGTGTINYATGAYSVTFNTAPANPVTADYQWEDSTNNGIADFTKSATRVAGEGFIFRQDDGKEIKDVVVYNNDYYCFHSDKTYRLVIGTDDTQATNKIFREGAGIPNYKACVPTGDGIYYIDDTDVKEPQFRLLTIETTAIEVVPVSKSLNIDLSGYLFDQSVGFEFNDYIIFSCRTDDSTINNRIFLYNKIWNTWDILNYGATCFAVNNGALWAGDSYSNNVYELFSGLSDDDSLIINYIELNTDLLDVEQLKKCKKLRVEGNIGKDQSIKVSCKIDNGNFTEIGTINGDGTYVDLGSSVSVGGFTLGKKILGGGSSGIEAYHFLTEISFNQDKFREITLKFEATDVGWAEITGVFYKDIRVKAFRIPRRYKS